jgi:hypothetical protein
MCFITNQLDGEEPSWEATSYPVTQELSSNLSNRKVYYCVHKSPPLVPILNHINLVHTTPTCVRSILILSTHLVCLGLPSGLFPSDFSTSILYAFLLSHLCYMVCLFHPPSTDHTNYTWQRVQVIKLSIMQLSPLSCHYIFFWSSAPSSQTLQSMSLP